MALLPETIEVDGLEVPLLPEQRKMTREQAELDVRARRAVLARNEYDTVSDAQKLLDEAGA